MLHLSVPLKCILLESSISFSVSKVPQYLLMDVNSQGHCFTLLLMKANMYVWVSA